VNADSDPSLDGRVVILVPTLKDARVTAAMLRDAGIPADACSAFDDALAEVGKGAAAFLFPEEALSVAARERITALLDAQPPWSDLPLLILTYPGADSVVSREATRTLGNVTLLERPLRAGTLVSAVRTAIRGRERQYQIRGHLAERERVEDLLRRADSRKDEFLATLGHELRNPLAPLLSGVHLLRLLVPQDAKVQRTTDTMRRQVAHLTRLVDDLLEVSRITRGLIDVSREPIDLVGVLGEAVDAARPLMESLRHDLIFDPPPAPIVVAGDAVRLAQIFGNLLTNAAKYSNPGGRIAVTMSTHADRVAVSVRDEGIGIPLEQLDAVFDMFVQVERSSRHSQGGLGIGLTLVRSLVELHGGRVEARSAGRGAGSEFVVELPVLRLNEAEGAKPPPDPALPGRCILVVDDNVDAADTLAMLLETLGATVRVAYSGREGLDSLSTFDADTILLDIGMPDMDGYEVARRVRQTSRGPDIRLIALSGWGQAQDRRRSLDAGFEDHMVKPPDLEVLQAALVRLTPLRPVKG